SSLCCTFSLLFSFSFLIFCSPPISTLFPYTTLFRSVLLIHGFNHDTIDFLKYRHLYPSQTGRFSQKRSFSVIFCKQEYVMMASRSEEHTSELQSRFDLVCRLLLDKKKINYTSIHFGI